MSTWPGEMTLELVSTRAVIALQKHLDSGGRVLSPDLPIGLSYDTTANPERTSKACTS